MKTFENKVVIDEEINCMLVFFFFSPINFHSMICALFMSYDIPGLQEKFVKGIHVSRLVLISDTCLSLYCDIDILMGLFY